MVHSLEYIMGIIMGVFVYVILFVIVLWVDYSFSVFIDGEANE